MNKFNIKDESKNKLEIERAVYDMRWQKIQDSWNDLDSILIEAEALWGKQVKEIIQPLYDCIYTLNVNIQKHLDLLKYTSVGKEEEGKNKMEGVIYSSTYAEEDTFLIEVKNAIKKIEEFISPHIKLK